MKLPKSVKIIGRKCPVKLKALEEGDEGQFITEGGIIEINKNVHMDRHLELLIHESFHAIIDLSGLGQDMSIEVEHVLIQHLNEFLKDNFEMKFKEPKKRKPKTIPTVLN